MKSRRQEIRDQDQPRSGDASRKPSLVTLLIPVWNERDTLTILRDRSRKALISLRLEWEMIFVDDGSTDGSDELLRAFHREDHRVRVILLSRNFGQHAALSAGLEHARGDVVVIMDGDLQLDPQDIPRLVRKLMEGYDLVGGWRQERKDPFLKRKLPSLLFNSILGVATGVRLHDFNCGFKAMRGEVVDRINRQGAKRRYLAPLLVGLAERIIEIPVAHHPRAAGPSKYALSHSMALTLHFLIMLVLGDLRPSTRNPSPAVRFMGNMGGVLLRLRPTGLQRPLFVIKEILTQESSGSRSEF